MDLFILIIVLSFLNAYISRIISYVLKCFPEDSKLQGYQKEINELKTEMNLVSMVDEFARYAKLQRRLNKLLESQKNIASSKTIKFAKIKYITLFCFMGLISLTSLILVWSNRSVAVISLPPHYIYPFHNTFNWFGNQPGTITAPAWALICSSVSKTISNHL